MVRALVVDAGGYGEQMMLDADGGHESVERKGKKKKKNLLEVVALAFCGERTVLDVDGIGCGWCWMRMVLDADELKEKEKKRKKTYTFSDVSAGLQCGWMRGGCRWMVVGNRSTGVVDTDRWWWAMG